MEPAAGSTQRYQRKQIVVDRDLQFSLLSTWLIMMMAFVVIVLLVLYFAFNTMDYTNVVPEEREGAIRTILTWNVGVVIVLLMLFGAYTLRLSHRFAGPAYRVRKSLEQIRGGDVFFTVRLRHADYLGDVADELNLTLKWLQGRNDRMEEAMAALERLESDLADNEAAVGLIRDAKQNVESLLLAPGNEDDDA